MSLKHNPLCQCQSCLGNHSSLAVDSACPGKPKAGVYPDTFSFGSVVAGAASVSQVAVLKNEGNADLLLKDIVITGPFTYSIDMAEGGTLFPGSQANITITFKPVDNGIVSGSIYLDTNSIGGNEFILLSGEGIGSGSSMDGYSAWPYNDGSALGGEQDIVVPDLTSNIPFAYLNGFFQFAGYSYTFDPATHTVHLASPLEPGDTLVLMLSGDFNDSTILLDSAAGRVAREALRRTYAEAGYNLVEGSFDTGGTVNTVTDVLLNEVDGKVYSWGGTLPKVVPAGSSPTDSGGIGAWVSVGDASLRSLFAGNDGKGLDNFYGGGGWTGADAPFWNFYSNPEEPIVNAMRQRFSIPTTDKQDPILWVEKKSTVTRDDGVSRWDNGAIFASLIKESGSAYATALTGAVKYDGGSGDAIAVHGRVQVSAESGQSFAGWFLNAAYAANQNRVVGIECDARSYLDPLEWRGAGGTGQYTVINVTSGGGTYGVHEYIRIPGKPSGSQQRAWTGILFGQNTIQPTDANGNGEAIRIRGSSSVNERYGGIAIGDADAANHYMSYGFKTLNANFTANNAVQLAIGHRIVWGESLGSGAGRWIEMLSSENLFNIQNSSLAMNGVRVLAGRKTGIFQLNGTADGTTKNTETVTLQELARYVKKVTDALITHGLIGPT